MIIDYSVAKHARSSPSRSGGLFSLMTKFKFKFKFMFGRGEETGAGWPWPPDQVQVQVWNLNLKLADQVQVQVRSGGGDRGRLVVAFRPSSRNLPVPAPAPSVPRTRRCILAKSEIRSIRLRNLCPKILGTSDAALDAVASVVPIQEISTLPIAVADPEFPVRVLTIITLAGHVPAAPILAFRAHRFTYVQRSMGGRQIEWTRVRQTESIEDRSTGRSMEEQASRNLRIAQNVAENAAPSRITPPRGRFPFPFAFSRKV